VTVTQILDEARNNLNAASDSLWSDTELYVKLYKVMLRFARKTRCIQSTDSSTTTVAGTATYTAPAAAFEIYRVEYNGNKLAVMDRRQYDSINPSNVTSSGTPAYYLLEGTTVTLYPTPDDAKTLKFYSFNIPSAVPTGATTLEVPAAYHDGLANGLTFEMCPKDLGHPLTLYWQGRFENDLKEAEATERLKKRRDRFAVVKLEEQSLGNELGIV
jgi:hypothetical protein